MIFNKLGRAVLLVSTLAGVQVAHAAVVTCPTSFTANPTAKVEDGTGTLTAASACEYLDTENNSRVANLANINAAGFFGFSDWTVNGSNLQVTRGGATGTWTIATPNFVANDYMIVFKDGNNTDLLAFMFNELFATGVWSTPFTDPPFDFNNDNAHNVSHYTIVQRSNPGRVPEPGVVSLVGLGLAGLAVTRRRRAKK
jgi:hypothetical protein